MSEGSISLNPTLPKYYWIEYTAPSGQSIDICTTKHPFQFIYNKNLDPVTKQWTKMKLLNWKQITKEEFEMWLVLNPMTMGENELEIYDTKDMD